MSDSKSIDLTEFERLRDEIDNRTGLSNQILSYELAALGAGIAVLSTYPDVLLGLAAISTLLWLFWIDHTTQIYKIAAYIELKIAPRLRSPGSEELGWERFLREIDAGDKRAEFALFGTSTGKIVNIQRTDWVGTYTAWLLGYSALVLLAIYVTPKALRLWQRGLSSAWASFSITDGLRVVTGIAILCVWWFARRQFRAFQVTKQTLNAAISSPHQNATQPHQTYHTAIHSPNVTTP